MQMAMRYQIHGISSTCANSTLDPSNMVMSVDLFNKAKAFISSSTTLKAVFQLDSIISDYSPEKFIQPG